MSARGGKFTNGMILAAPQTTTSPPVLVVRRGGDQPTSPSMETCRCDWGRGGPASYNRKPYKINKGTASSRPPESRCPEGPRRGGDGRTIRKFLKF